MYNNEFPSECTSYVLAIVYVSETFHQYICYVKKQSLEKTRICGVSGWLLFHGNTPELIGDNVTNMR